MGIYVNKGTKRFETAINSKIYVDKTGLIEYTNSVINTEQSRILSSRPRRFGKSMTVGMLAAYYDKTCDSKALFDKFEIASKNGYTEHMNKYDVIQLDIADIRTELGTSTNIAAHIAHVVIEDLKEYYGEYIRPEDKTLPTVLMNIYEATGTEFVILIDEWDAIFRDDKYDDKSQREYMDLLWGLFKGARSMSFTALAYITGILPIKRYNSESALNNFYEFTMTAPDTITEYIGFTEDEVKGLCDKYGMNFEEMKRWYDGYNLNGIHVYNPKSVIDAIRLGECSNYWTQTVSSESLKEYIGMNYDGLKEDIVAMLSGTRRSVNIRIFNNDMTKIKSKDAVLTVLIHLGYLAYDTETEEAYVPNGEVRYALSLAVKETDWTPVINALKRSDRLLKLTWAGEADEVAEYISQVHMENTSILQYNDENSLSCVITLAYYNAINDYTIIREMPAGLGFADIVYIPQNGSDKPAMVVELKYNQKAKTAIGQIKAKQYPKSLEKYKGNLLLVGINYDKETKEHTCEIEEMNM
jgi:ribosomal protein S8